METWLVSFCPIKELTVAIRRVNQFLCTPILNDERDHDVIVDIVFRST